MEYDASVAGHLAIEKTLQHTQWSFWFLQMKEIVCQYCASCDICQKWAPIRISERVPIAPIPCDEELPFTHWSHCSLFWKVILLFLNRNIIMLWSQWINSLDGLWHAHCIQWQLKLCFRFSLLFLYLSLYHPIAALIWKAVRPRKWLGGLVVHCDFHCLYWIVLYYTAGNAP